MVKRRRIKKRIKRRVKKIETSVRTDPVDRPQILGGGGTFSIIKPNPFQESVSNMMTAIQQNLNNNINTTLNQMKTESQIMNEKLMAMQYDERKHLEAGNQLQTAEMRQKIDDYTKQMETKYGMIDKMEDWLLKGLQFGGQPKEKKTLTREPPENEVKASEDDIEAVEEERTEEGQEEEEEPLKVVELVQAGTYGRKLKEVPVKPVQLKTEEERQEEQRDIKTIQELETKKEELKTASKSPQITRGYTDVLRPQRWRALKKETEPVVVIKEEGQTASPPAGLGGRRGKPQKK